MSLFTKKFIAVIDSSARTNGTSSSFQISIPLPKGNAYNRVILLSAIIPKSYYLIQDGYNTFQIEESLSIRTITVPVGNYTLTTIQTALITAMAGGYTYTMLYSSLLNKFTFTVTGNSGYLPSFIFTNNLYEVMGFAKNSTNVFVLGASATLTSTNMINLNPYECLYIRSDMTSNESGTIMDIVPMCMSPNYSFVYYQNTSDHTMKELVGNNNSIFNFSITDNQNRIVSLNGKEVTITLCIHRDTKEITDDVLRESLLIANQQSLLVAKTPIQNRGTLDESIYTIGLT